MSSSVSLNSTLDNLMKVNQLSDSVKEKINKSLSEDKNVEEVKDSKSKVEEEPAVSQDSVTDSNSDSNSEEELFEIDYNKINANYEISKYIKNYTSSISDYLTYKSENKVSLGESSLKNVLQNKFKIKISKSAYSDVGMGEYYNLNKLLDSSKSINSGKTNIIRNLTNFTISV